MNKIVSVITPVVCFLMLSGCSPTSAPTESVTNTLDNTVNGLLDVSSSSTPGSSDSGNAGVEAFTRANYADLKIEMATGDGEHVHALATLLKVPQEKQAQFLALVQEQYMLLYPTSQTPPHVMLTSLYEAMDTADFN
ncbi:DUF3015 family protein [Desulfogranum japonicum]|uniref:DUF3015 family protein n=1 Tax=Desulfogranum japonicum TaxID=231447 RepID=UPI000403CD6B|nr:DUF3015 family protein [Desulfogranum japonicum]